MNGQSLPETNLRNADLGQLVTLLQKQADVKYDVVVTQDRVSFDNGVLVIAGAGLDITDEGVDEVPLRFNPTQVFDDGIADRLGIPRQYLRKMRDGDARFTPGQLVGTPYHDLSLSVLDANVNTWLQQEPNRKVLVRAFHTGDARDNGIARAFLSNRYAPIDNYDVLLAALDGVNKAGVNVQIDGADLTERTMRVRFYSPDVVALAPTLLRHYRSPWENTGHGQAGLRDDDGNLPVVWGGFEVRNSETGGGAFSIVPRLVVKVCTNGLTVTENALREVHLGGALDDGLVRMSDDTRRKAVELVTARARDAVQSFLDPAWVAGVIDRIESESGKEVTDAVSTIERVGKTFGFSEGEQASILDCFIKSGDLTAGGVMQAVTATAQVVENPERSAALEDAALDVLAAV